MALRKPRLVRAKNQRHVRKDRRRRAERLVQEHLLRRIRKMIRAANHVRDAHVDVVDYDAELVHRLAKFLVAFAGAQQDEILDLIIGKFALAKHRVRKSRRSTSGNLEADRRLRARCRGLAVAARTARILDRKSTRLNSSHSQISYAVFCLKKKKKTKL